ncbi:MAG: hypothetical protein IPJ34_16610 [Myxococcales bacterium]|nr:hypothetical protein [Myxococcales bacterium]
MLRRALSSILIPLCACARQEPTPTAQPAPPAAPLVASPPAAPTSIELPTAPQMAVATAPAPESVVPATKPAVELRNIGMHIGGGPNDDATKAPFQKAIAAQFDALAACWATLPTKSAFDFGVDLLVPAAGGQAKVDRPRSAVKDAAFVKCATAAFAAATFAPSAKGLPTKVSTSVHFTPK